MAPSSPSFHRAQYGALKVIGAHQPSVNQSGFGGLLGDLLKEKRYLERQGGAFFKALETWIKEPFKGVRFT